MIPVAAVLLVTHGAAVGEVTDRSAVVWARSSAPAEMVVAYAEGDLAPATLRARSEAERDLTAKMRLENLTPATLYRYRVHFEAGGETSETVEGAFRTAPSHETPATVRFVIGGDLGGHGFCREEMSGYAFFERMRELRPDFFIANGDHEVINDFGAGWPRWAAASDREGYPVLVRAGRETLFDFHPLWPHPEEPERIYRSFRWGAEVELFLLDARSYRSANDREDSPAGGKTLLGRAQLDWLKTGLGSSNATWKIVSSDVPLSIATGTRAEVYGRDAFADGDPAGAPRTGSETELRELLSHLDREDVRNVVFVVTDVHFATSLRYEIDLDSDGDKLLFHELLTGPMSAGLSEPRAPDATFAPQVLYVEGGIFNFGFASADGSRLAYEVRDDRGRVRKGSELTIPVESLRRIQR